MALTNYPYAPLDAGFRANTIYQSAMTRMYGLVALGVIITAVGALTGDRLGIGALIYGSGWIGLIVALGLLLGLVFGASRAASSGNIGLGLTLYLTFTAAEGLYISPIVAAFSLEIISQALLLTAAVFIVMSVIGMSTKRNLSGLGPFLFAGLIGLVVVVFVNLMLNSGALSLLISLVMLPLFMALTVYETKQMKELALQAAYDYNERAATQVAVMGSIGLYLNVLNMFIAILRLIDIFSGD